MHNDDLSFYDAARDYEHHFNNMEFEVRKLASAWLLVTFGAIGFVVRGSLGSGGVLEEVPALVVIPLLGNVGLYALWTLDQVVYHRLLEAVFATALRIEQTHERVPPVRSMMLVNSGGNGMAQFLGAFYLLPALVLATIALAAAGAIVIGNRAVDLHSAVWIAAASGSAAIPVAIWLTRRWMLSEKRRRTEALASGTRLPTPLDVAKRWFASQSPQGTAERLASDSICSLAERHDYVAPDGSEIRNLIRGSNGILAHCVLPAGQISAAVRHQTVEELWYVLEGSGAIWRARDGEPARTDPLKPGDSARIAAGTAFQFRADSQTSLKLLLTTMPPWPGPHEAVPTNGGLATPTAAKP